MITAAQLVNWWQHVHSGNQFYMGDVTPEEAQEALQWLKDRPHQPNTEEASTFLKQRQN